MKKEDSVAPRSEGHKKGKEKKETSKSIRGTGKIFTGLVRYHIEKERYQDKKDRK